MAAPRAPRLHGALERLSEIDRHYLRKENQLFPYLEQHGVEGPSKVMWALHDDIRAALKETRGGRGGGRRRPGGARRRAARPDGRRHGLQGGEDPLPHGARDADRRRVGGDPRAARTRSATPASPPATCRRLGRRRRRSRRQAARRRPADGLLELTTGGLTLEQLEPHARGRCPSTSASSTSTTACATTARASASSRAAPASSAARYRTATRRRACTRCSRSSTPSAPASKDTAEFWIEIGGKFLHIRYFALRDAAGGYRGVVETVQDVTQHPCPRRDSGGCSTGSTRRRPGTPPD